MPQRLTPPANSPAIPASQAPGNEARPWSNREWRVTALVAMIAIVSLADLYLTLLYLHSGGMAEANPIARWIMHLGSPGLLVAFKVAMVSFTCTVLWWFRQRTSAEAAAWVGCIAMALLCFQWYHYTQQMAETVVAHPELTEAGSWVQYAD